MRRKKAIYQIERHGLKCFVFSSFSKFFRSKNILEILSGGILEILLDGILEILSDGILEILSDRQNVWILK